MQKVNKLKKAFLKLDTLKLKLQGKPKSIRICNYYRSKGVIIGDNTHIMNKTHIGTSKVDEVEIGSNCVLTGCTLLPHDASTKRFLNKNVVASKITIKDDCFIGFNSIILRGVTVNKGAIVGAGAVVTKDVPEGMVVAGNPAKVVCSVEDLVKKHKKELNL